jgi:hypothetical protein
MLYHHIYVLHTVAGQLAFTLFSAVLDKNFPVMQSKVDGPQISSANRTSANLLS